MLPNWFEKTWRARMLYSGNTAICHALMSKADYPSKLETRHENPFWRGKKMMSTLSLRVYFA
jgi:hypothetical protein